MITCNVHNCSFYITIWPSLVGNSCIRRNRTREPVWLLWGSEYITHPLDIMDNASTSSCQGFSRSSSLSMCVYREHRTHKAASNPCLLTLNDTPLRKCCHYDLVSEWLTSASYTHTKRCITPLVIGDLNRHTKTHTLHIETTITSPNNWAQQGNHLGVLACTWKE